MFPFWMDSVWSSLPQLLSLLAVAAVLLLRVATGPR
jgi:hypothetical protein